MNIISKIKNWKADNLKNIIIDSFVGKENAF